MILRATFQNFTITLVLRLFGFSSQLSDSVRHNCLSSLLTFVIRAGLTELKETNFGASGIHSDYASFGMSLSFTPIVFVSK